MPRRKTVNIIGQRFGLLLAIEEIGPGQNYDRLILCRCDCGTEKSYSMNDLRRGQIKSCGCSNDDRLREMNRKNELSRIDGVIPHHLRRKSTHNKSTGIKGVSAEFTKKGTRIYRAYITVGGVTHRLGNFYDLGDAVNARKRAEEIHHKPILEKEQKNKSEKSPEV